MEESLSLSIVVPARNEGSRLEVTAEALAVLPSTFGPKETIFVVDSTSDDDTLEAGRRAMQNVPGVRLEVVDSKGKGYAVSIGVQRAQGEIVVLADADLSVSPDQLVSLIDRARTGALAIASRSVPGAERVGEPALRFVTGRLFNFAVRSLILPGVHDTQCGFKAFPRTALTPVFEHLSSLGWCFDVELIATARRAGIEIVEVPVLWRYGHGSKMKLRRDAPEIVGELYALWRRFGRLKVGSEQFRDGVTDRP